MHALLDNGTHLVLISPKLIEQLGLKIRTLHKPKLVNVAFSREKKKTKLYHYIKLSLTSLDSIWTLHSVRAIITPSLCLPIILRLPWLQHNLIVTDHAACTCIDKKTLYDLLNPPPVLPPPLPKPKFCEQIKIMKADKKLVLVELMMVCNNRLKHSKLKPEKIKDFDVVSVIHNHIEVLATKEALMQ